jgi:hypothetical protein
METGLATLLGMLTIRVIFPIVVTVALGMLLSRWDARRAAM